MLFIFSIDFGWIIISQKGFFMNADVNEPIELVHLIETRLKVNRVRLFAGDFVINDVGIERKTVSDFLSSLSSKRLFWQIEKISNTYQRTYLIIEGLLNFGMLTNPAWVCYGLRRITWEYNTKILFTTGLEETARVVCLLAKSWEGDIPETVILTKTKLRSVCFQQESLLIALPGIGEVRSRRILKSFTTPRRFFMSSRKEWKSAGIGQKTARKIKNVLDTPYSFDPAER